MRWKDVKYEILYYPHRVLKYKTLWLWGERMRKIRAKDKRKKYRQKGYTRISPAKSRRIRENIGKCQKCGTTETLQVHHIIPVSKGGSNNQENLMVVCNCCHIYIHQNEI